MMYYERYLESSDPEAGSETRHLFTEMFDKVYC